MDLPAMRTRAFPGNRTEEYRAGITPRILVGTFDHSMKPLRDILKMPTRITWQGIVVKRFLKHFLGSFVVLFLLAGYLIQAADKSVGKVDPLPPRDPQVNIE